MPLLGEIARSSSNYEIAMRPASQRRLVQVLRACFLGTVFRLQGVPRSVDFVILVVEDHPDSAEVFVRMLKQARPLCRHDTDCRSGGYDSGVNPA